MHDIIVLDSRIIAAIFFPEKISGKSLKIAENHDCITVDLTFAEVANVVWKRRSHTGQDVAMVKNMLDECTAFIRETFHVLPAQDLVPAAYDLAYHHRITIYDILFLAAAIHCASPLVTADKKNSILRRAPVAKISTTIPFCFSKSRFFRENHQYPVR